MSLRTTAPDAMNPTRLDLDGGLAAGLREFNELVYSGRDFFAEDVLKHRQ